jgi:hypothetical protein
MHLNFHFLRFLCPELEAVLTGKFLVSCFSQNKDELIMSFEDEEETVFLRANLLPGISCLSLVPDFKRGKRNTISLFEPAIGNRVSTVQVCSYERAFFLHFESGAKILFKLFGNKSNILWYSQEAELPELLFRNLLREDWELKISELSKNIELEFNRFQALEGNAAQFLPTLGKIPRNWLKGKGYIEASIQERWQLMQELLDMLDAPFYSIIKEEGQYVLSLLPEENSLFQTTDPIIATNELFKYLVVIQSFEKEKQKWVRTFEEQQKRTTAYLQKTSEKLESLQKEPPLSQLADVIMANLYQIPKGAQTVELFNFYTGQNQTIPLKQGQTPQKQAENLYRKSKNRKLEIEQLEENLQAKRLQALQTESWLSELSEINDFRGIKSFLKQHKLTDISSNQEETVPYKRFEIEGFEVLVGKSSKANDELLRRFAWKEDLWLHAKDVPGSHVLLKYRSGINFPKTVIERAAAYAAYYSKNRNDTLAAVMYTPAKYVRKVKGAAPGAVMVDKEKVILVPPQGPQEADPT